jgi:hypothetical protein
MGNMKLLVWNFCYTFIMRKGTVCFLVKGTEVLLNLLHIPLLIESGLESAALLVKEKHWKTQLFEKRGKNHI